MGKLSNHEKRIRADKAIKASLTKLRGKARLKVRRGTFIDQQVVMVYFEETAPYGERFEVTSLTAVGARALAEALIALADECPSTDGGHVSKEHYIGTDTVQS